MNASKRGIRTRQNSVSRHKNSSIQLLLLQVLFVLSLVSSAHSSFLLPFLSSSTSTTTRRTVLQHSQRQAIKISNHHPAKPPPQQHQQHNKSYIRQLFQKAKTLERKGQWRKAVAMFQDILHMDPHDAHTHLAMARLEARRDPPHADGVFARGTRACPQSVHLWQAYAVYRESLGQLQSARLLFEKALQIDPYNPYVCHAYGRLERKCGNHTAARTLWETALQKKSTAALVCQMGELLIAQNQTQQARQLYKQHSTQLQSNREKTEVYLAAAWLEERHFQNYEQAEKLIRQALAMNPKSSMAQVALARLAGRKRNRLQGEKVQTAVTRKLANACIGRNEHEDGRVYNAWASIEAKARKFSSARKILQSGLERYPADYALLQAAGNMEERLGNYTGARDLYSASLKIQPSGPTLVAFALLELRQPMSPKVNRTVVRRLFEEALLIDPRHGPAYNSYGTTELRWGNVEQARKIFDRGVAAECSDVASVYHGYARMELSLGNVNRARQLLQQGRREVQRQDIGMDSPHRERALFLTHTLGMLELNSNHPKDALEIFHDGIECYGNSSQLLLGAAMCEVKLGNEEKARKFFERSVLADETHAQAWQAWGVLETRAGNWKTAKTLYECGIRSAPRHGALWLAYAIAEGRFGNVENSRSLFARGLRNAPRHVPLLQAWASLELREGNFSSAKTLITEALTRDKGNGSGWLIAAEIENRLGNRGLESLILRRGIECSPTYAELYRALGSTLVRRGKVNEAREIYEKGIEVDPLHAPLYHALAELEAQLFNVKGLADLNKKASMVFSTNALDTSRVAWDEAWGAKIRARRSRALPKGVVALAQRIVDDDDGNDKNDDTVDPKAFIDHISRNLMEDGLVGQLLNIDDIKPSE